MIRNDTIVYFGNGNVIINIGRREGQDKPSAIIFRNSRKSFEIGAKGEELEEYATKDTRVVLDFGNVESLNVVLKRLNELKMAMEEEKKEKK
jgi:hypothetical protein